MSRSIENSPIIRTATTYVNFCHEPSERYKNALEQCGWDPRVVEGKYAIRKAGPKAERGWYPGFDSRMPLK